MDTGNIKLSECQLKGLSSGEYAVRLLLLQCWQVGLACRSLSLNRADIMGRPLMFLSLSISGCEVVLHVHALKLDPLRFCKQNMGSDNLVLAMRSLW